jgi:DNA repair exonuclease SbcCD ATPase subunit
MIILKTLTWSNAFSYGPDNSINFDEHSLVQLLGKNGHGKTSIATILEEVLFNKNSKGIKKADILNRYTKDKKYTIGLVFTKNEEQYEIKTVRGTTQSVLLFCNGEDISEHTATATYKLIEEILGFDHKTFTQIVYQSSSASLEFLTATDTNRKKFLIDLLNLSIYNRGSDIFKALLKTQNNELELVDMKIKTINDWLAKFSKEDLSERPIQEIPFSPAEEVTQLAEVKHQLVNIENTNKKIIQNNTYNGILNSIDITEVAKPSSDLKAAEAVTSKLLHKLSDVDSIIRGTGVIKDTCGACGQPIDNSHKKLIKEEALAKKIEITAEFNKFNAEVQKISSEWSKYDKFIKNSTEWERYYALIDKSMSTECLDRSQLEKTVKELEAVIASTNKSISQAVAHNAAAAAHNAKVTVILGQLDSMRNDLAKLTATSAEVQTKVSTLQLLVKTFSTTGLVAYKIECLVKDLEELTNEYLLDMSDGRFQLAFKINSSDKLNVIITDNGNDIDIMALSNGERARVNVSTLLAIRKLMQSLSNSRINLLVLDETLENLDAEGKDRLIEVLLKEESLNTVLVSHSYTHPLIEKINIIKENNISRIE